MRIRGPAHFAARASGRARSARAGIAGVLVALVGLLGHPATAVAQVHGDVGARLGVTKRFVTGGQGEAGFGPGAWIEGHLAVLPFVRAGGYASLESSPALGPSAARQIGAFGLHLKVFSPAPRGRVRLWAFGGVGYAVVHQGSHHQKLFFTEGSAAPAPLEAVIHGGGGGFLDVPVGIGAGYRLRPGSRGAELTVELGSRFGAGFGGSVYRGRSAELVARPAGTSPRLELSPLGNDSIALFLNLGVTLEL